jgi:hypothetical protein
MLKQKEQDWLMWQLSDLVVHHLSSFTSNELIFLLVRH